MRAEAKLYRVPDDPEIWFLVKHRNRALRIMRWELRHSTDPDDLHFCAKIDRIRLQQLNSLLLIYAAGHPEQLSKIAAANTLIATQKVFIEVIDECTIRCN